MQMRSHLGALAGLLEHRQRAAKLTMMKNKVDLISARQIRMLFILSSFCLELS